MVDVLQSHMSYLKWLIGGTGARTTSPSNSFRGPAVLSLASVLDCALVVPSLARKIPLLFAQNSKSLPRATASTAPRTPPLQATITKVPTEALQ